MTDITDLLSLPSSVDFSSALSTSPQAAPQQQAAPQPVQQPHGLKNILGMIGDALLVSHGLQPMYRQRLEQQQVANVMGGFLQNPDQAIAGLMSIPGMAGDAVKLYKDVHPASEVPLEVKLYNYRNSLTPEQQIAFDKVNAMVHPGLVSPMTLNPGDTLTMPGQALPRVTDRKSYDALPPGAKYIAPDGSIRPKPGGATASTPSQTFQP